MTFPLKAPFLGDETQGFATTRGPETPRSFTCKAKQTIGHLDSEMSWLPAKFSVPNGW